MLEAILVLIVIVVLLFAGRAWLKRRTADRVASSETPTGPEPATIGHARVVEFHVVGNEARVTFDVPLDDDDDEVLNEILVDEAMEVLRQKRHTLPIADVHEVVVFAGRANLREVARSKLPTPGVLPPPPPVSVLNLGNVTRDPFAAEASELGSVAYETKSRVPEDDLPPLNQELRIPKGLERGLRASGIDVANASGEELILGLMGLFGYSITPTAEPGTYNAAKGGETTLVVADGYTKGDHPQIDEAKVRAFAGRFSMSGAQRGLFISEKYAPYMIYEMEKVEPRLRFLTRERLQDFIDSMAIS